jgi:hypothetical protein
MIMALWDLPPDNPAPLRELLAFLGAAPGA